MQASEIQQLLQQALPDDTPPLRAKLKDRHLHILLDESSKPPKTDPPLAHLLALEVQTFASNVDRLTLWHRSPNSDRPTPIAAIDLDRPLQPNPSDPLPLTGHCFIKNQRLLRIPLPLPHPTVASAVLYVHVLKDADKQTLLTALPPFFDRPDKTPLDIVPPAHRVWLADIQALPVEKFKSVAIWLSRYCDKPNCALPLLEDVLADSPPQSPSTDTGPTAPSPSYTEPDTSSRARAGNIAALTAAIDKGLYPWKGRSQVSLKDHTLSIQLQADAAPNPPAATALVYTALTQLQLPHLQTVKLYGIEGDRSLRWKSGFQLPSNLNLQADYNRFKFDNPTLNLAAFPLAAIAGMAANTILPFVMLPFHIWIHEFGHATVAWFAGRRAIPLPFGWTNVNLERELFVYLGVLFLLALLGFSGWREGKRWAVAIAASLAVLQFYMTWLMPVRSFDLLLSFGGIGGEFYLSTFLMVCFYFPLPDRLRWDFWRFAFLIVAAGTFCQAFWQWHTIELGLREIPWGSIFGAGDAGGDMNRLNWQHGWSATHIIETYSSLGKFCLLTLVVTYGVFAIKLNPQAWFALRQRAIVWWLRHTQGT
ncbi:hypothetical protein [Synechococcus sp. PCC 7336]|uniref:hypothetical protein n=1 Tax=Synechococcus sp. PCC 7336 TaxID=195250 RepID=UPI000345F84F|nr:hypothetical protein [Synechococcus sp. PCC 7336]